MRPRRARHVVTLAVLLSVGLTAVTIWAVVSQSRALQEREWANLENGARVAAAEQFAELRGDLERAFATAAWVWPLSGRDGLDQWILNQSPWVGGMIRAGQETTILPIAPLETPLPANYRLAPRPPCRANAPPEEAAAALADLRAETETGDPLDRARAWLALADCLREMENERRAADGYLAAADALRSHAHLKRHAFEAEVEALASLIAAGDEAAGDALLRAVLERIARAHPWRYRQVELDYLQRVGEPLLDPPLRNRLAALRARAARRARAAILEPEVARQCAAAAEPEEDAGFHFATVTAPDGAAFVVAARRLAPLPCLALVAPVSEVIAAYWHAEARTDWRVLPSAEARARAVHELGPAFGHAVLVPAGETAARLEAHAARRTAVVLTTAAGAVGGWAIVVWMILRAIRHQRELVRLQRRFVADVSHELKTPLAMIRLLAETLEDGRVRDPLRAREYYGTITREAERLSTLLDNILDFSRMESGKRTYQFGDCDVGAVVRQAWGLFEPQFAAAGFERHLSIADDLPRISADGAALQQVLVNLLQNAFRYAGEQKYIRVAVQREGYLVVITVEDRGIGMTRSQLERLGNTFFRAEDTRVRQTRGTGLGLAIVNHIVQAHRGKVEVHSRPGRGTKFSVWIPFDPKTAPAG